MIEVDYVKISFLKVNALKSYRPKHPPERYFFEHVIWKTNICKLSLNTVMQKCSPDPEI